MSKTIRSATVSDIAEICQLIEPFVDEFAINESGRQLFTAQMIQKMVENPEIHYLVYIDQEKIVGVIAYKQPAHMVHFFISRLYQGQGIGRILWDFVLKQVQSENIFTFTVNSSCQAQGVYEKFGFSKSADVIENHGLRYVPMSLNIARTT
ncbi:GNAT family N-acetyltransferase [Acinetobacter bereziniae]|jgi:ribosomal protein S18 acetylase RimI-like enzyme|uniref:GNAT family N-acetyltransferase n=1 Tax=Acinetobacter TaxID=469 RepID=UPI000EF6B2E0|nr:MULTISPECIES: GNAT family N-acetyltransferase [Acinetobacter]MBJ8422419.1 GNAT family N-acetyltransferase [Acinetobacter bereziniae]MCU4416360.1 GNAT family N-acetyltransferase [Acinetobacter bereziniae]MCU4473067.1 GNAT family N-acetyltransferase [Acinetobacter bereziniae]MCU4541981.1 GNAT family N-acetyltransferase [Acinetobacter bereziniae]MCU4625004.1 GNAT family N-acetyltransferase [Acinetobacter bereziniae]